MQVQTVQPHQWISFAISAVIVGIILFFRIRRMRKTLPLRLERLWLFPAIYAALAAYLYATHPPHGIGWLYCSGALLVGAALGWQRGRMMRIDIDRETHALNQSQSPAAILFIVALIVIRMVARTAIVEGGGGGFDPMLLTDILLAFALGLFSLQRLEMFLRARRLLALARAGRG
ncbi:CcdC protein domain-containing protein [Sphingosinithalassobacter portus]|uniref:CcdC protein domain-containing protein n=1 Tax=Stakelama portus TaxID=2676234 RepID=UPI000D6E3B4D|nr:CcdC protein domain-containing protein [Sphingosinithalassobacter portus]